MKARHSLEVYHVLGGKISPIEGVGPNQLEIASLVERVSEENIKEIVFALSPTIEGDTTNFIFTNNWKRKRLKSQLCQKELLLERVTVCR